MALKSKIMKKIVFFLLFCSCQFLYSLDFKIYSGIGAGKIEEKIYSSKNENLISLLEWEEEKNYRLGMAVNFEVKKNIFDFDFNFAFPSYTGILKDSDYNSDSSLKINYSESSLRTQNHLDFNFSYFYNFPLPKGFFLAPGFSFKYSYAKYHARNGKGWYGSSSHTGLSQDVKWNDESAKFYPLLSGIDLTMHNFYFLSGLNLSCNFSDFEINFSFLLSPFNYNYADDYHLDENNTGMDFHSITANYCFFKNYLFNLNLKYKANNLISIFCSFKTNLLLENKEYYYVNYYTDYLTLSNQKMGLKLFESIFNLGLIFNL